VIEILSDCDRSCRARLHAVQFVANESHQLPQNVDLRVIIQPMVIATNFIEFGKCAALLLSKLRSSNAQELDMSRCKTAIVLTLAMAPTFAAGGAMASQLTSASSGDAAWLATQLNQTYFASHTRSPINESYAHARADDAGPTRVLPVAQRYRGTNPTGQSRAWCAIFANMVLARAGFRGTDSAAAISFARYGRPASGPAPGVIAVWPHHVGFVVGSAEPGRIRVVSGNHNRLVEESTYSTRSVMAFRYPIGGGGGSAGLARVANASVRPPPL
jgi:uncharacterized protein (TIGR02594 family)